MKFLILIFTVLLLRPEIQAADLTPRNAFASLGNVARSPVSAFSQPHAALIGKTMFTAYQDSRGRPLVMAYDTGTQEWSGPVRASGRELKIKPGGNPALCADRNDIIHLFIGGHQGRIHHMKSLRPAGFEKWKVAGAPDEAGSFPQVFCMSDGTLRLFYRNDVGQGAWVVSTSDDDGDTWGKPETLVTMNGDPGIFCLFARGKDATSIHALIMESEDEGETFHRLHYLLWDADDRWRTGNGAELKRPVRLGKAPATLLANAKKHPLGMPRVVIDGENKAYVLARRAADMLCATWENGKLKVSPTLPDSWPLLVKRMLTTPGVSVPSEILPSPWYTTGAKGLEADPSLARVWLGNVDDGFQDRKDGPAPEPPENDGEDGPTASLY